MLALTPGAAAVAAEAAAVTRWATLRVLAESKVKNTKTSSRRGVRTTIPAGLKREGRRTEMGGGGGGQSQERRKMEVEAKKAQKRQMEEMRQRVQEAYSGLKKKRRAGQTQFVGSDL